MKLSNRNGRKGTIKRLLGAVMVFAMVGYQTFSQPASSLPQVTVDVVEPTATAPLQQLQLQADTYKLKLAAHESLGFFQDISEKDWLLRKQITNSAAHHPPRGAKKRNKNKSPAAWYYQSNWNEDFSCFYEVAVGGTTDGHKYVCDPHRFPKDCLVYSVGSNKQFMFESSLLDLAPHCEIHIFDPTDYESAMKSQGVKASYHSWGLKSSYKFDSAEVQEGIGMKSQDGNKFSNSTYKTLNETMQELGHVGRRVDVFKIDCEGCEWRTYRDWIFGGADLRQILLEVHNLPTIANTMFQDLHDQGYVIFHKEPNIQSSGGNCVEFAFLKLHKDFFQS
jgi:hypothetical protein